MEIKQLRTFLSVCDTMSFSKTAEQLDYSQSSISDQIKALEASLDCVLFQRLGRRIHLTEDGEILADYAKKILELSDQAILKLKNKDATGGTVTIAAAESLAAYKLPNLLKAYREQYPDVTINLQVNNCEHAPGLIKDNKIDVAFILGDESHRPFLEVTDLFEAEMRFLISPEDPMAKIEALVFNDLADQDLILTHQGCYYRKMILDLLAANQVQARTVLDMESIEGIKLYTKTGFGISYLPYFCASREIEEGSLVALACEERVLSTRAQLIYHKDKWLSPAAQAFLDLTMAYDF